MEEDSAAGGSSGAESAPRCSRLVWHYLTGADLAGSEGEGEEEEEEGREEEEYEDHVGVSGKKKNTEERVQEALRRFRHAKEQGCNKCTLLERMPEEHFAALQRVLLVGGWRSKRMALSLVFMHNKCLTNNNVWWFHPYGKCCAGWCCCSCVLPPASAHRSPFHPCCCPCSCWRSVLPCCL